MLQVDKDTFQAEVLDAKGLVLVDFYGDGCVPCEALMPDVLALSEKYGDKVKFIKLNTSGARRLAISQKVLGLPTVSLYRDGVKIEEVTKDDANKENIEAMITKNL
ncbi:MAG: thioredoxin family protein [Defluviitaleaceae bacterium]|nr:thioredoxin family protein [Defluviitaleaceae bacterium]MCL2836818.1 thioredoxin family protein [Defluviitaleaceae bacterium]